MHANEKLVRDAYLVAERKDARGFAAMFTEDGVARDESTGAEYRGDLVGGIVDQYASTFPDMHRELDQVYLAGNVVIVELSLNATHKGPLKFSSGTIAPTGREIHAPCCDVWTINNGKIQSFNCYNSATVILSQIGVLSNIEAASTKT